MHLPPMLLLCSFGMVLYELLHRKMVVAELMYLGSAEDAEAFAYKASHMGWRLCVEGGWVVA